MARKINARLRLQGTLHVVSALHVGDAGEGGRDVDLALAENGQGQPYVPGTSLAGAFRDWHAQAGTADELWGQGPMERGARAPDGDGWASRVHVEDANVHLPDGLHLSEVRDGVGIDRRTGAAAKGVKYDRRVLPAGTKIDLLMTVEVDDKHREAAERLLVSLRRGLEQGEIRLGAARSRGLGKVTLSGGGVTVEDLGSRDGVVAALLRLREDPAAPAQEPVAEPVEERSAASEPSAIRIEIEWRPIGPLMVKASAEGLGIDSLPLTIATEGGRAPLLPGSSIKGAIRAHAERIVRTVLERPIPAGEPFQEQVSPDELIDWVFGYAPRGQRAELPKERGIAALWISDCRARTSVPVTAWEKVEEAGWISHADWADHNKDEVAAGKGPGTQTARGALEAIPQIAAWDPAVHVALDRWTGGQATGRLFSILEPHGVDWPPLEMELRWDRLKRSSHANEAIALVLLVLDDMARGELPLGFGTNRGLGELEVIAVTIQGSRGPLDGCHRVQPGAGLLTSLPEGSLNAIRESWAAWVDRKTKQA